MRQGEVSNKFTLAGPAGLTRAKDQASSQRPLKGPLGIEIGRRRTRFAGVWTSQRAPRRTSAKSRAAAVDSMVYVSRPGRLFEDLVEDMIDLSREWAGGLVRWETR